MSLHRMFVLLFVLALSANLHAQAPTTAPSAVTREQVETMIREAGKTPPDWWDSVVLKYPPTLDLSWKDTGGPWNPQKNVGQYVWDVINPNPNRWREGVKLMHHVMSINAQNPVAVERGTTSLAHMYADLLQDYPRGAFWSRKSGKNPIQLAKCYWKMGSKEMAVELLRRIGPDRTRNASVVKLWADLGELDTALRLAENMGRAGLPDAAYLAAGDACRTAGQLDKAKAYYEKVLAASAGGRDLDVNKKRARASLDGLKVIDLARVADGKYTAESVAYAGPVQVSVTVVDHAITDVKVTRHTEKQFYTSIEETTAAIIEKQGTQGVDTTSGATVTSEAIINATAKALSAAQQ